MSQIKSFTISLPIDTIGFEQFTISKVENLSNKQFEALKVLANQCGEITYEKPQILKRPDGSVISELEEGQEVVRIFYNNYGRDRCYRYAVSIEFEYSKKNEIDLKQGLIFLPEDTDLAEKKAKQLTKQFEIQFEIDRLNAEEGETNEHKKVFCYDEETDKVYLDWADARSKPKTEVSKATAETILAKYSQQDLKFYLGIII